MHFEPCSFLWLRYCMLQKSPENMPAVTMCAHARNFTEIWFVIIFNSGWRALENFCGNKKPWPVAACPDSDAFLEPVSPQSNASAAGSVKSYEISCVETCFPIGDPPAGRQWGQIPNSCGRRRRIADPGPRGNGLGRGRFRFGLQYHRFFHDCGVLCAIILILLQCSRVRQLAVRWSSVSRSQLLRA